MLRGHTGAVSQLAFHPQQPNELCTISSDKTVRFWDTRSGKSSHMFALDGENISVGAVAARRGACARARTHTAALCISVES